MIKQSGDSGFLAATIYSAIKNYSKSKKKEKDCAKK